MTLAVDQVIGNFVLVRKLAEGGMGSVWVAHHETLARDVAVKFLSSSPLNDAESVGRFSREAVIAARIHSDHAPEVFEHGFCDDGTPFLVMTLIEGVDLATKIERDGRFSLPQVVRLVDHVGRALSAAHELGVVHRDVKPTNIILRGAGEDLHAYLIDFGIAKTTQPSNSQMLTHPGITIGTPSYMSPEQLMGAVRPDERTDIWSLGVVAYLCLTGKLPFVGDSFRELCLAIHGGQFIPVSTLNAELPRGIDAWFATALSTAREHRFPSVKAMTAAFGAAVGGSTCAASSNDVTPRPSAASLSPSPGSGCVLPSRESAVTGSRRATVVCAIGGAVLGAVVAFFIAPIGASRERRDVRTSQAAASVGSEGAPRVKLFTARRAPLDGGVDGSGRHSPYGGD
jgi:serine/threonine protein kinase